MERTQATVAGALRENWFWSEIFRDHATFIHDNLAPKEDQQARWCEGFRLSFEKLAVESAKVACEAGIAAPAGAYALSGIPAESPLAGLKGAELTRYEQEAARLSRTLTESVSSIRAFKEQILGKKLDCAVKLNIGPTLVAHMIVEAEEAQRVLGRVREGAPLPPALEALHHHLVWLPDASGHASLHNKTDGVEHELQKEMRAFQQVFDGMHIRALELYSMVRIAPRMVGALKRLNRDAMTKIATFRTFLGELREHLEDCEVLSGGLVPLLADHMLREELYYTEKIAQVVCADGDLKESSQH
ncbi:MAG TPA: DUF2935 domain-containing protein [Symbiobacteriaceae bacterium]|jgi:hypothetical protein